MAKDLQSIATQAIDDLSLELNNLSQEIWNKPELNFQEHHAHKVLTQFLEQQGFNVERGYIAETGFRATFGDGNGPNVCVISEYDALPEVGHACGHNLIAEVGVAAGIAIKAAMIAHGQPLGKVTVLGTPAEEGDGGKLDMISGGAFADIDIAMMSHPTRVDTTDSSLMLALDFMSATFHGRASHAAGAPWEGINALDAAVTAYSAISNLRQHFKPTWRVHGIFSNGGTKPNIIPEEAELTYYIRAPTKGELEKLKAKVVACFHGAATSSGCTVDIKSSNRGYLNVITNKTLAESYAHYARELGVDINSEEALKGGKKPSGSTDMGNVTYIVPGIHPFYSIGTDAANHTRDFTKAAGDRKAQTPTIKSAKALALTALDIFTKPGMLEEIKENFKKDLEEATKA